jgi:sodium/hydrogen antiporter
MDELHLGYALVGSLAVVLAATSTRVRNLPVSEPLLALLLGVVAGPDVLGLIHVPDDQRPRLMTEVARVLLAVSLMGVGLRYPARTLRSIINPTVSLVAVGMVGMAAMSAGLMWLILGVPVALALLLGACITPTDPVLASSVVTGKPAEEQLPLRTRQLLSAESGTNDGLALPLVLVGLALVLGESWGNAAVEGLCQVGVGVLVGLVAGWVAGRVVSYAARHSDVDRGSTLVFTLLLAIAVLGLARVFDADGVLSVFIASLAYNYTVTNDEVGPQNTIDEAVNRYLVLPLFLLLGTQLPWAQWRDLGWAAVALASAVLLLRRPPVLLALVRPLGLRLRDGLFLGWFGPIGVSALFYLSLSEDQGVADPRLWTVGTLIVTASTLAHGVSAAPGRHLYRRAAAARAVTNR